MFASRLIALPIIIPVIGGHVELAGDALQQRGKRHRLSTKHDAWISHVGKLHSKSQPVRIAAPLTDQRQIGFTERVMLDQFVAALRQRKQAIAFGRGKD